MKRRLLTAIITLLALIAGARAEDAATLVKEGDAWDARLQNQKALDSYLAAEKAGPPTAQILYSIAREYGELMADTSSTDEKRALGEKALDYAKRAVALDPKNAMAQLSLAVCYGRIAPLLDNKTKIAYSRLVKDHAEKSLELDPNNDLTYNVLGAWNYELAGLNPFLRAVAGMIYGTLPDASYDEAVKDYQKALELNPNRLANHIGLGRTYAAMGKSAEARAELERGLSMPNREKDDPFEKEQGREALRKI
jgi:tetratricopeptide (TPR) repeat protein